MVTNVTDFTKDMASTVASSVFGGQKQKIDKANTSMAEEADETLFFSNPIMKGLILLRHKLDQINQDFGKFDGSDERIIKEQICGLLDHMLDLRQDFLLSNVLSWYDTILSRCKNDKSKEKDLC